MSIRHIKKETPGSPYFFICTEQFTYTTLFTFLHDRAALLLNTHTKIEKRMFFYFIRLIEIQKKKIASPNYVFYSAVMH